MGITSLLFAILVNSTQLTFEPVSVTGHFSQKNPDSYVSNFPIQKWQTIAHPYNRYIIWSPEAHLGLVFTYFQLNTGWTIDTESQNAFHLVGGPSIEIFKNFRSGFVFGPYIRQAHYPPAGKTFGPRKFYAGTGESFGGEWEALPMLGGTLSYSFGNFLITTIINNEIINIGLGLKFDL